jgi:hypothetical protein
VVVSAVLPSNASTISGGPRGVGQQADGDLRLQVGGEDRGQPLRGLGAVAHRGEVGEVLLDLPLVPGARRVSRWAWVAAEREVNANVPGDRFIGAGSARE